MSKEQAVSIMTQNAENGTLCTEIVKILLDNYEQVDSARNRASHEAGKRYFESMNMI